MSLIKAMRHAGTRATEDGWPRNYYWAAVWWRLHSRESKNLAEPMRHSRNQMALYRDIKRRPEHYKSRARPHGLSDWQWSGFGDEAQRAQAQKGQ